MKALFVTPYYYPKIGGLENYARQLANALQKEQGWDIVVATSDHEGKGKRVDTVDGMPVYRLPILLKFSNTPLNPLWPLQLRKIIRHERPDVIIAHSPVPSMSDAVALAAGRTPIFLTYHAATLLKGDSLVFNTIARAYGVYEKFTFSRARRIIAGSAFVKDCLNKRTQAKTVVVPNAVWEAEIITRRQPDTNEFLFISSLDRTHAWKGLDHIIAAIHGYIDAFGPDIHLTVMGDGDYRPHYEALAEELGVAKQVEFIGAQTGVHKDRYVDAARALVVYPSTGNDAFPTVILEAWARQLPVVAAAMGPLPSLINDHEDGYLVGPNDPTALALSLHEVVTANSIERQRIADAASKRTKANYTWERQAAAVAKLAEETL